MNGDDKMESRKAILLVSDIHYSFDGKESQFQQNDKNEYYQKFENYLKKIENELSIKFKYVVILGDLVDHAKKEEYTQVANYIEKLCKALNIETKNVLIIPGNHDIERAALESYCDKKGIFQNQSAQLFDIKLDNYTQFYKEFTGESTFNPANAILNCIDITEENTLILGVNSLVKEGFIETDHYGYVDTDKLKNEIENYVQRGKTIFVTTHHSVTTTREKELATIQNTDSFRDLLGLKKINTFIYGHHHLADNKINADEKTNGRRYIEVGSLGKIVSNTNGDCYNNSFTIAICEEKQFDIHVYHYINGDWEERENKALKLPVLSSTGESIEETDIEELPRAEVDSMDEKKGCFLNESSPIYVYESSKFLFDFLKKEGNYREGHFHWRDNKKTLGWINIAAFLGNNMILEKIRMCIIDIFENNMQTVGVIVGYGMEGNIIGSSLVDYWIGHNKKYFFYPSVHKEGEHNDFEKNLWNQYQEYESILLICDIMPADSYLREIIDSDSKLQSCSELYVLSVFTNLNLLNETENIDNKVIKRFTLAEFNVPVCDKQESQCIVCTNELSKVYSL